MRQRTLVLAAAILAAVGLAGAATAGATLRGTASADSAQPYSEADARAAFRPLFPHLVVTRLSSLCAPKPNAVTSACGVSGKGPLPLYLFVPTTKGAVFTFQGSLYQSATAAKEAQTRTPRRMPLFGFPEATLRRGNVLIVYRPGYAQLAAIKRALSHLQARATNTSAVPSAHVVRAGETRVVDPPVAVGTAFVCVTHGHRLLARAPRAASTGVGTQLKGTTPSGQGYSFVLIRLPGGKIILQCH